MATLGQIDETVNELPYPKDYPSYSEFSIKKKSGKQRKIVNPNASLKRYQKRAARLLYKDFKRLSGRAFHRFHGFVPHRNPVTAATAHIGFAATGMYDFSDFFDNVRDSHLKEAGLNLSTQNLELLFHKDGYTAQGFPSSPMLTNIALIPFIKELESVLKATKAKYALTIFADDIQISLNETSRSIWKEVGQTVKTIALSHQFKINPNKTRIKFAKYGSRRILGVNVTDEGILPTRKTNRKVRAVREQVKRGLPKGQVLGGLRTWQKCHYPKGVDIVI